MEKQTFPIDWRDQPCFLVAIPRPLVPYVGGLLKIMEKRGFWQTSDDYERGYAATVALEACLMAACLDVLFEKIDAQYRLLNGAIYGQDYSITSTDPLIVDPPIAPFVSQDVLNQDSIMGRLDRLTQLTDNTFNGTETPLYSYTPNVKEQLQAIIDAMGTDGTDLTTIISDLEAIALLVG
jgi:hypothetical protein